MPYIVWGIGSAISLFAIRYLNSTFINKVNRIPLITALLFSIVLSWISVVLFTFIVLVLFVDNNTKINGFYDKLENKFNP